MALPRDTSTLRVNPLTGATSYATPAYHPATPPPAATAPTPYVGQTDASLSGPRYGVAAATYARPRVGRTDISSSGPAYGVQAPRPGAAAPTGGGSANALSSDPIYRNALAGINTSRAANQGQLGLTRQQLIAAYGETPAGLGFAVDPTTAALARAGTLGGVSTTAQTTRGYNTSNADDAAEATARGLAHSGFVGSYLNENLGAYQRQQAADQSALLGQLGTAQQAYLTQQQQLQTQQATAANDAYNRQVLAIQAGVGGR